MPSMLDTLELVVREAPRRLMGTPAAMRGRFGTREVRGYEPTTTLFHRVNWLSGQVWE